MRAKPVLGTANFGLDYGIANKRMLSEGEVFAILEKAVESGFSGIDTARVYGNAEEVIGKFFRTHGKLLDVITKIPDGEYESSGDVESQIEISFERLSVEKIDTMLLHSFNTLERHEDVLLPVLARYVSRGLIGSYGVSVYHPREVNMTIEKASKTRFGLGAVQMPLNLFDRRFLKDNLLEELRAVGIALYGRSIFLQGLFFMDGSSLQGPLRKAAVRLQRLKTLAGVQDTTIEALALRFAASSGVDYVVLGVDSAAQLEKNAALIADDADTLLPELKSALDAFELADEEVILPYKWKQ